MRAGSILDKKNKINLKCRPPSLGLEALAQKESAALADDSARAALSVYCFEDPTNIIAADQSLMYRIAAIFIVEDAALTGDMSRHAAMLPIRADKISPHFFFHIFSRPNAVYFFSVIQENIWR